MAQSPAHRFGQIIGEVLEEAILPVLEEFARSHGLYLDKKGSRPARRGKKCSWVDLNSNSHDLDFVLERGGTPQKIGMPAAFIETAWRRYTKHSRNKAQEIQGAIEPLALTHHNSGPFKGAVLAGVFTKTALNQLRSLGFTLVYLSCETVVSVFRQFGIDAAYDEDTPDDEFQAKVDAFQSLSAAKKRKLSAALVKSRQSDVDQFMQSLSVSVSRQVERIVILVLHGQAHESLTVEEAIQFIKKYEDRGGKKLIERYEIEVRYSNGDTIRGSFHDKVSAIEFLKNYQPLVSRTR